MYMYLDVFDKVEGVDVSLGDRSELGLAVVPATHSHSNGELVLAPFHHLIERLTLHRGLKTVYFTICGAGLE